MTGRPLDPALGLAVAAAVAAALHVVLARWRDLGPFTVGLAGAALVLGGRDAPLAWVAGASVLAAIAWIRGGRAGVGRPGLVGVALAATAVAAIVPALFPGIEADRIAGAGAGAVGAVALGAGLLALERPAGGRRAARWVGEIPIDVPRRRA